ncbi:MAG: hypothetical protein LUD27_02305 [Clostridia bacterium]|nr:hypothetical protein [Clostridia bacterium]
MNNDLIEDVVLEKETVTENHSGFKKGAIIVAVIGAVGTVGYLAHRFVIKPIIKKVKAKKNKKLGDGTKSEQSTITDDGDDESVEMPFPDEE